jgi:hypothetical protein
MIPLISLDLITTLHTTAAPFFIPSLHIKCKTIQKMFVHSDFTALHFQDISFLEKSHLFIPVCNL